MARKTIIERLLGIDRRVVFLVVFLAALIPLGFRDALRMPIKPGTFSTRFFDEMEKLEPGEIVVISGAYDPSSAPEIQPMVKAAARHVYRKGARILTLSLDAKTPPLLERAVREVQAEREFNGREFRYGRDVVHLGYMSGFLLVIKAMNRSFKGTFPKDKFGTPLESLEMLKNVDDFEHVAVAMEFASMGVSGAPVAAGLVMFAKPGNPRFRVLAGATAVMTPEAYPYLQSGQVKGFLGGLKGVADYEELMGTDTEYATAGSYMPSQSVAHLAIILFIALGNLGYFLDRRRRKKER